MAELLANLADINTHLPANVQIDNEVDVGLQVDAHRLIVGQLTSVFTTAQINAWVDPDSTPDMIRSIAGRLIAAKYYARVLSGEAIDEIPGYAMDLYKEAISMLVGIKDGSIIVVGPTGDPITGVDIGSDAQGDVFPNDTSVPGPVFSMGRIISST